jgi:hypothetical protein
MWQGAVNFLYMRSSLLESVIVTEFKTTEVYSSLYLTKAKYSIRRLSKVEKDVIVGNSPSNFSARENKIMDMTMKMKFAINMHTQLFNIICSQYKGISKSVLIFQNVHLPGKTDDFIIY